MYRSHTSARAAGLVIGATLAITLALPALANSGHQSGWNVAWDDAAFLGSTGECEGVDLAPGEVLWHFVQTSVAADVATGELAATFDQVGPVSVVAYKKAGAVLHWAVTTGRDTLLGFTSDVSSSGQLNLSHICAAAAQSDPSEAPSGDPGQDPSQAPSGDPGQDPSQAPSGDPGQDPSQAPSEAPSGDPSGGPETGTPTSSPSNAMAGATGTPRITPPPTDVVGGVATSGSSTGWLLAVVGLAALVAGLALTSPARRTTR